VVNDWTDQVLLLSLKTDLADVPEKAAARTVQQGAPQPSASMPNSASRYKRMTGKPGYKQTAYANTKKTNLLNFILI
jgi:hypothetical protein